VKELATITIRTEAGLVELDTCFGFEVGWHMLLLDKFMTTVSKRASVLEHAGAS